MLFSSRRNLFVSLVTSTALLTTISRGATAGTDIVVTREPATAPTTVPSTRPAPVNILTGDLVLFGPGTIKTTRTTTGPDMTLSVHVENTTQSPIGPLAFRGLTATFSETPTGTLHSRGDVHDAGTVIYYPSLMNPVGCVTAHDHRTGISIYSPSEVGRQSLFNGCFVKDGILGNPLVIEFYTTRVLTPGESCDVSLVVRQTTDLTPAGLLSGYRATLVPTAFTPDTRPAVQCIAGSVDLVSASNPNGYSRNRNFSSSRAITAYCNGLGRRLKAINCQSVIFWQLQGGKQLKSDGVYASKFDEFPDAIKAKIPELIAGLKGYGVHAGLCASGYGVDVKDPASVKAYVDRYTNAVSMGFDGGFYIDTFGGDYASTVLVKKIREAIGPKIQLWTEEGSGEIAIYAGRYCELSKGSLSWTSPEQFADFKYLFPDSPWLCVNRTPGPLWAGLVPLYQDAGVPLH